MKLVYGSDLHLEFSPFEDELPDGEVLILAGDIVLAREFNDHFLDFFERVCAKYELVLFVMGNHEHYLGELDTSYMYIMEKLQHLKNFHILDNTVLEYKGVKFFGGTMWTDFNGKTAHLMDIAKYSMNDYNLIRISPFYRKLEPLDTVIEFNFFRKELKKALKKDTETPFVVISHHGPSVLSIDDRYKGDELNAAYVADLSEYMLKYANLKYWIHGHIHTQKDYVLGHTRVLCNPRGYPGEAEFKFFEFKVVEI